MMVDLLCILSNVYEKQNYWKETAVFTMEWIGRVDGSELYSAPEDRITMQPKMHLFHNQYA